MDGSLLSHLSPPLQEPAQEWNWLRTLENHSLILSTAAAIVAVVGVIGSVMMQRVKSANPTLEFPWNPIQYSWRDMKLVISDRPILRVTLGMVLLVTGVTGSNECRYICHR